MRFGVLGPLAVWTAEGTPVPVPGPEVRALLAALLAREGEWTPVPALIDDLWQSDLPANPVNALQIRVSRLRRALDAAEPGARALIEYRADSYRLQAPTDAAEFQALLRRARTAAPHSRAAHLTEALARWRGPALPEFAEAPFAAPVRQRWQELRLTAVADLAEARLALGEQHTVLAELAEWVRRHPAHERLRASHLRALYLAGRQPEALAGYAEFRACLTDQGLDPSPALTALHQAILTRDPALTPEPVRHPGNLPAPVTELIGRETNLADLRKALASARLVTLTGPGGVGKTRLALAAAAEHTEPDGAWLVELAGVRAADPLAEAVMTVLGIRENTMLGPIPAADPLDHHHRLTAYLAGKRLLLLLDNCEHLPDEVATLSRALLHAAPGLRILTTSREPLSTPGELVHPVAPLDLPADHEDPLQSSAVRLFHARAQDADPAFTLTPANTPAVIALVRDLDGLPLALELAAAKIRSLGVHQLAARLDDRFRLHATGNRGNPARQRTLHALLDWSWDLLTDPERVVLRRLAVLDGGTLPAIEAICADTPLPGTEASGPGPAVAAHEVAEVLSRLVDRSMVTVVDGGARYRLLHTVAAYARARLTDAGEAKAVRARHSHHYLTLAETTPSADLAALDAERGNFQCALDTAVAQEHAAHALRLADALAWYWLRRGRVRQAARWCADALALPGPPSAARARVRCWAAGIAIVADLEPDQAASARTALTAFDDLDDPVGEAMAHWFLAYVLLHSGDLDTSEELTTRAATAFRALGHSWGLAVTTCVQANHALTRGDLTTAHTHAEAAVALFRAVGDRGGELLTTYPRATLAELHGDHDLAERLHRDGLALAEDLGMWAEAADRLCGLGRIALLRGDHHTARDLLTRAGELATERGFKPGQVHVALTQGQLARRTGDFTEAEQHLSQAAAWYRRTGRAPGYTTVLTELGHLANHQGDPAQARTHHAQALTFARHLGNPHAEATALEGLAATHLPDAPTESARLLGTAHRLRERTGTPLADRSDLDQITAATRDALGEQAFALAFSNGSTAPG
ncbi:BTAD domain-containing putative transcriptional regulator [Crossiella sp. CA-258035]|uniref:ATP-binding protein n=1 Tax=Crossiella sp. CA-258035 TaxID=2981138 RepID=UPI0024BBEF8D|nr:BTAD domain-containing putative transcriptional regulator [Crossiella sp. CA-258035]WHT16680.1 BTAD domain-containing putative transcriptional regulator [Crossiella sp. CA-258035]